MALRNSDIADFELDYVGEGQQRRAIEKFVSTNGLEGNVHIHGFVQRESVSDYLDKDQVFVMISERETFGLVYIEAMSRGCIVVASRNEGMEGIVEDGVNGFLCNAGDSKELVTVLNRIANMSEKELIRISDNAYNTAFELTDENVARNYLGAVLRS